MRDSSQQDHPFLTICPYASQSALISAPSRRRSPPRLALEGTGLEGAHAESDLCRLRSYRPVAGDASRSGNSPNRSQRNIFSSSRTARCHDPPPDDGSSVQTWKEKCARGSTVDVRKCEREESSHRQATDSALVARCRPPGCVRARGQQPNGKLARARLAIYLQICASSMR